MASDGGVFSFGDAGFFGSMGGKRLNAPVVGIQATSNGQGYWLVASDGGMFSFGDAGFFGSTGNIRLNQPVVGMAATPTVAGTGSWRPTAGCSPSVMLVSSDRWEPFASMPRWSASRRRLDGGGYWMSASDGGVFTFGNAGFFGSMGGQQLQYPVTAIAATPDGGGYWLMPSTRDRVGNAETRRHRRGGALTAATAVGPRVLARHTRRHVRRQHRTGRVGFAESSGHQSDRHRRASTQAALAAGSSRNLAARRGTSSRLTSKTIS